MLGQNSYPAEKIGLLTDRGIYISGESILFSGTLSLNGGDNILSEAIYIEFITPTGHKINQTKVKIVDNTFEGQLIIPEDALSGYYYMRAYTKWMRNGPVYDYAYVLIKLINANNSDLLEINDSLIDPNYFYENDLKIDKDNLLNKSSFQAAEIAFLNSEKIKDHSYNIASISVYPYVAEPVYLYPNKVVLSSYDSISYYPETRGLTISGKVIDDEGPIPFHKVNLHLKDEKDFISVLSDSLGHFYISLPERYSINELFVIAATESNEKISVLIDQDFCTRPVGLKVPPFSINDDYRIQLLKMAQTSQLNELFNEKDSVAIIPISHFPFYGSAFKSIVFDSYIELDSLSQYFTDLPSWVNVKKVKGKRKLFISGPEAELSFIQPLVLIDFVPIDDIESILKIDPRRIERFEVVIKPYIHGGIIYGGIIALYSRNADFGGFTFPESAMYINYDFYAPLKEDLILSNETEIEFNNTFIWIPDIVNEPSLNDMELVLPSIKGDYIFQFQTLNALGEKSISQCLFHIE